MWPEYWPSKYFRRTSSVRLLRRPRSASPTLMLLPEIRSVMTSLIDHEWEVIIGRRGCAIKPVRHRAGGSAASWSRRARRLADSAFHGGAAPRKEFAALRDTSPLCGARYQFRLREIGSAAWRERAGVWGR